MYQRKDGDGSLFQNRKQKDSHPDVRGDFVLDGKEYEIAGWQKSTRNGDPWWSLKIQPKRQKDVDGYPKNSQQHPSSDKSDIPF
jgi:hypothetical protein